MLIPTHILCGPHWVCVDLLNLHGSAVTCCFRICHNETFSGALESILKSNKSTVCQISKTPLIHLYTLNAASIHPKLVMLSAFNVAGDLNKLPAYFHFFLACLPYFFWSCTPERSRRGSGPGAPSLFLMESCKRVMPDPRGPAPWFHLTNESSLQLKSHKDKV